MSPTNFSSFDGANSTSLAHNNSNLAFNQTDRLSNLSPDGAKCMLDFWSTPYPKEGVFCNATWDSFFCWPTTPANTTVERSCVEALLSFGITQAPGEANAKAFRICESDGSWYTDKTNFSACLDFPIGDERQHNDADTIGYLMFIGSMLSFLALTLTLIIFSYFKSLRCERISVHKHLAFSLLIRVLLNIVISEPIVAARTSGSYTDVDWLCKAILITKMYATLASVNWMFIEGMYLHSRVTTSVFSTKSPFRMYYVLGWGFPLIVVTLWAVMMAHGHQLKCWHGYARLRHIWILTVPVCIALAMNLLFLINIIRILVTKLRASEAVETTQVRKAIKATAVLFPLLGLPNLFVCVNPKDKGDFEDVYLYMNTVLESSQGIFVAILYCFTNSEVIETIKKEYNRRLSWQLEPSCNNNRRKSARSVSFFGDSGPPHKSPLREVKKTFWIRWSSKYQQTSVEVVNGYSPGPVSEEKLLKNGTHKLTNGIEPVV